VPLVVTATTPRDGTTVCRLRLAGAEVSFAELPPSQLHGGVASTHRPIVDAGLSVTTRVLLFTAATHMPNGFAGLSALVTEASEERKSGRLVALVPCWRTA
jgi:hypothetical protein